MKNKDIVGCVIKKNDGQPKMSYYDEYRNDTVTIDYLVAKCFERFGTEPETINIMYKEN
jgi:hypothetical protein